MLFALLIFCFLHIAVGHDCDPEFADSCFTSVQSDLKYMLDLKKMTTNNISMNAVHELCMALDDSLNCTSDIIDNDCYDDEGKSQFDSWVKALRGAYRYVCEGDDKRLIHILQGISCWSVEDFVLCTEEQGRLDHIRSLLHTKLTNEECEDLHYVTSFCRRAATVGSCREQDIVYNTVNEMLRAFFMASDCDNVKNTMATSQMNGSVIYALSTMLATIISLVFIVSL